MKAPSKAEHYRNFWGRQPVLAEEFLEQLPEPPGDHHWLVTRGVLVSPTAPKQYMRVALINKSGEIVEFKLIGTPPGNQWTRYVKATAKTVLSDYAKGYGKGQRSGTSKRKQRKGQDT